MNGSPSVKVALFIRNGGSESPCRWFYVTEIYISERAGLIDSGHIMPDCNSIIKYSAVAGLQRLFFYNYIFGIIFY